jgi:hypothetical protein
LRTTASRQSLRVTDAACRQWCKMENISILKYQTARASWCSACTGCNEGGVGTGYLPAEGMMNMPAAQKHAAQNQWQRRRARYVWGSSWASIPIAGK